MATSKTSIFTDIISKTKRCIPVVETKPKDISISNLIVENEKGPENYSEPRLYFGPYWMDSSGKRVPPPSFSKDSAYALSLDSVVTGSDGIAHDLSCLIHGDNLEGMKAMIPQYKGKLSAIYVDPPFNVTNNGNNHLKVMYGEEHSCMILQDERVTKGTKPFNFWELLYERLIIARELLDTEGSIWMQVNAKNSDRMGLLMDDVFGQDQRRNQIIRELATPWNKNRGKSYPENHDFILWYTKTNQYRFLLPRTEYNSEEINKQYPLKDNKGRYRLQALTAPGTQERGKPLKTIGGISATPPKDKHWRFSQENLNNMWERKEIIIKTNKKEQKTYWYKQYYNSETTGPISSIWTDTQQRSKPANYPCWKSPSMLERLLLSSTNEGDIVGDIFCGSGLFSATALKYRRKFVAFDCNKKAIEESKHQLQKVQELLKDLEMPYNGFATYSLKHL